MSELVESICKIWVLGLELTVLAAIAAIPIALLVLVIDRLAGRRLSPGIHCWLWIVVAVRLLLPFAPASPMSAQQIRGFLDLGSDSVSSAEWQALWQAPPPQTVGEWMAQPRIDAMPATAAASPGLPTDKWDWERIAICGLILTWATTALAIVLRAAIASLRFARRLNSIPCVRDPQLIDLLRNVCESLGVSRIPRVKYVEKLSTPALFGLFRPTLCLPEESRGALSNSEVRMIALHEVAHLRRRDGFLSWLLVFVRAIHWFNPIAWITVHHIEHYRELACDDAVRQFTRPQERGSYTNLLMRFAATHRQANSLGLLGLWFARPARSLARRIEAFTESDQPFLVPKLASATILVTLALVGLTDAASTQPKQDPRRVDSDKARPVFFWEFSDKQSSPLRGKNPPPLTETRKYDLAAALEKVAEIRPKEKDARQWLLKYLHLPVFQTGSFVMDDDAPNQIALTASQAGHDYFTHLLGEVSRFGTTWQVVVSTRVLKAEHVEAVEGIDWRDALKFAGSWPADTEDVLALHEQAVNADLSLSMESVSFEYAPYLATILDEDQMSSVVRRSQAESHSNSRQSPKVTLFSGQAATIRDESLRPFVVGVSYIVGELATAAQPTIEVLPEGAKIDIQTAMINKETLGLNCRLTLSFISDVDQAKLPGQDVTIQIPRATRRTVSARCQVKRGETLLIAPLAGGYGKDNKERGWYYAITTDWFPDPGEGED